MKITDPSNARGAALLTTLILVSAVALVVMSYFAVTRQKAEISGSSVLRARAALGEKAGFEEAKALLQELTANDEYLVTAVLKKDDSNSTPTRYTYVSLPGKQDLVHTPLFLGGKTEAVSMPNINVAKTTDITDEAIAAPQVEYDDRPVANRISIQSPMHLNPEGETFPEQSQPRTHFAQLPQDAEGPFETRYTYWMEDLEGYPNLDVVGTWTDYPSSTSDTRPSVRLGYASTDPRAGGENSTAKAGLQLVFPDNPEVAYAFPREFRGQMLLDQVAPGLSPREIDLSTWPLKNEKDEHPYDGIASLQSSRLWTPRGGINGWPDGELPSKTSEQMSRFSTGLRSYLREPFIPYGHNYVDEGKPRWNINVLIANRDMEMANIVNRNLYWRDKEGNEWTFNDRRGGFPASESYVGTLAANAIDYADEDSAPSTPANTVNAGKLVDPVTGQVLRFRGVDAYCPVNEFFVRFEYRGARGDGPTYELDFSAHIYAEFWNPTRTQSKMENVSLNFKFLEGLQFTAQDIDIPILETQIVLNEPNATPASSPRNIIVEGNQYHIQDFGEILWRVPVTFPAEGADELADQFFPANFRKKLAPAAKGSPPDSGTEIRATYELTADGIILDRCGRSAGGTRPDYGFFFQNEPRSLTSSGDGFMRFTAPSLSNKGFGVNTGSGFGSHIGDPWLVYYSKSTAEGLSYKNASPGGRNLHHSLLAGVSSKNPKDTFKIHARVREWPDGGYDNDIIDGLKSETERPRNSVSLSDSNRAPWKISNQHVLFSLSELGNLHDPIMWAYGPTSGLPNDELVLKNQVKAQSFDKLRSEYLKSLPTYAVDSPVWGGGNTLRIGRPEHELFDKPGMRASQWLDLFHTGTTGTNLGPASGDTNDMLELYAAYDSRDHQDLATAHDLIAAKQQPYSLVYDEQLLAQGRYEEIRGRININSAPTAFEIETLLRGPITSSSVILKKEDLKTPQYTDEVSEGALVKRLQVPAVQMVAADVLRARPYYSPSHLARVFSESLKRHNALPQPCSDAEAEEPFARLFNATTLSSRHFRVYTYAETSHEETNQVLARTSRVYEVFLKPVRDATGAIESSRLEILRVRNL